MDKSASALLLEYFPKDGDLPSNHACLLVLAESVDARQHEINNFPKDGDRSKLEEMYSDLGDDFEELGDAYRGMGSQINSYAAKSAYLSGGYAREISMRICVSEMSGLNGRSKDDED